MKHQMLVDKLNRERSCTVVVANPKDIENILGAWGNEKRGYLDRFVILPCEHLEENMIATVTRNGAQCLYLDKLMAGVIDEFPGFIYPACKDWLQFSNYVEENKFTPKGTGEYVAEVVREYALKSGLKAI